MRRLPFLLLVAIATLAGLILAGMMTYLPNHLPDPFKDQSPLFFGVAVVLIILIVGGAITQAIQGQPSSRSAAEAAHDKDQAQRNRQAMLEKVRLTWIAGVLDHSIARDARIVLGLEARPDAVIDPVDLVVQRPKLPPQPLSVGTAIRDIYDQLGGALLILGAPGGGKTTLLLELTRDLLDRATVDPQHPIPVVFPLSTWAAQRRPLAEWLVDELTLRYHVPRNQAQSWIDANAILPLLDGLDEVAEPHRTACADAINTYRQTRGYLPLVVASRIADYEALTTRLQLHGAVLAQPLKRDQVRSYLCAVGVAAMPSSTSPLWELLDTPLMLTVAALAYAAQPLAALPANPVVGRDRLFAAYIDRMFQRNTPQRPFTDAETRHYLSFFAYQLQQHNQTSFYLEQMQLDWLPDSQKRLVGWFSGLVGALVGALVGVLVGAVIGALVGGLLSGLGIGLLGGLLSSSDKIEPVERLHWLWLTFRAELPLTLSGVLIGALSFGISGALVGGRTFGLSGALIGALSFGISGALVGGLSSWLLSGLLRGLRVTLSGADASLTMSPNQGIRNSARNALLAGLVFALIVALVVGLISALAGALVAMLASAMDSAPISVSVHVQSRNPGFEQIREQIRAVIVAMVDVLGGWLSFTLLSALGIGLVVALSGALVSALGSGFHYGGRAYIRHYILRFLLIRTGSIPLHLVPFLEYATQRIFLRRVGGGYIFIHRLLLEHMVDPLSSTRI